VGTFDYKDLNAYLLLAVGLAHPTEGMADRTQSSFGRSKRARRYICGIFRNWDKRRS